MFVKLVFHSFASCILARYIQFSCRRATSTHVPSSPQNSAGPLIDIRYSYGPEICNEFVNSLHVSHSKMLRTPNLSISINETSFMKN
jgi:hypothetical protein